MPAYVDDDASGPFVPMGMRGCCPYRGARSKPESLRPSFLHQFSLEQLMQSNQSLRLMIAIAVSVVLSACGGGGGGDKKPEGGPIISTPAASDTPAASAPAATPPAASDPAGTPRQHSRAEGDR